MRLSVNVPNFGDLPESIGIGTMAAAAERAGADGVWLADHILLVDEVTTGYPYAADGIFPLPPAMPFYDPLATCAFLASATETCRIGTGVLILPQRNVLELAKVSATIDRLSGGRLVLGIGSGWNRAEMEAIGYSFANRGRRTDEMLAVLRDSWSGTPAPFDGQQVKVRDRICLYPTPWRATGVPLLVGGMGEVSQKRAAVLGDGWLPIAFVDNLDVDALRVQVDRVRSMHADVSDSGFDVVLKLHASAAASAGLGAALVELDALGLEEVVIDLPWSEGVDAAITVFTACREVVAPDSLSASGAAEKV